MKRPRGKKNTALRKRGSFGLPKEGGIPLARRAPSLSFQILPSGSLGGSGERLPVEGLIFPYRNNDERKGRGKPGKLEELTIYCRLSAAT